jgi:hypothetical protein
MVQPAPSCLTELDLTKKRVLVAINLRTKLPLLARWEVLAKQKHAIKIRYAAPSDFLPLEDSEASLPGEMREKARTT